MQENYYGTREEMPVSLRLGLLRDGLDRREEQVFSVYAARSSGGLRRAAEYAVGHRQSYGLDADRVLHSRAYTRYIDKTQVFSLVRNDHITHRVLHVQLVSKIARTIGRFLRLNEDLIEAIALGHDIGHPPFGHDGERQLAVLCREHGLPGFQHNIQSIEFLDRIEKRGRGWNLTLQTMDGILCHDGEVHSIMLRPRRAKDFSHFEQEIAAKGEEPRLGILPMTLEGCVVRVADTIGYIGRDIEDAIELGLIERSEIPAECRQLLGDTNGKIVYRLVEDLLTCSLAPDSGELREDAVGFSPEVAESLGQLKRFNYERIYHNPTMKKDFHLIDQAYRVLFEKYLAALERGVESSEIFSEFLCNLPSGWLDERPAAAVVRDFLAGMTDNYFLNRAVQHGCPVPKVS